MTHQHLSADDLIAALFEAARKEDWDKVEELMPQLANVDPEDTAEKLLTHVGDPDPNIRDMVASALEVLSITPPKLREEIVLTMVTMATTDEHIFAAGRGATVLIRYQDDEQLGPQAKAALDHFKIRVQQNGWGKDIKENIPQLKDWF